MRIDHLYRYPVKGLTAEALDETEVEPGGAIPWDRTFALAQGDSGFDPASPTWLHKVNFMCLMKNARIAALRSAYDPGAGVLTIMAPDGAQVSDRPATADGRAAIGAFLIAFLDDEARGQPVFHHIQGHVFGDQRAPVVSLMNLASLRQFERDLGAERDLMRFRANIYFTSETPFEEFAWVGQRLQIGGATLRVTTRTVRCPATQVNPETAERDANPPAELRACYGHMDLGVHAEVIEGGRMALGDAIEVLGD